MNKKRINRELLFVLTSGAVCFAFMAFLVMVFPAVRLSLGNYKVTGIEAVFGGEVQGIKFNFNLLSFIGYMLAFVVVITSILAYKNTTIIFDIITIALTVIVGVLIALEPVLFRSVNQIVSEIKISYLIGPILGMIFSVISLIFSISCIRLKLN